MIREVEESRMTQAAVSVGRKGSSGKQQRECSHDIRFQLSNTNRVLGVVSLVTWRNEDSERRRCHLSWTPNNYSGYLLSSYCF